MKTITTITRAFIVFVWLCALTYAAQAQTTPLYCRPTTVEALRTIWAESGNGVTGVEATFIMSGTDDDYTIEQMQMTGEKDKQTVHIYTNTFALFHIHPNNSSPWLSTPANNYVGNGMGDTGWADRDHFDIYAASQRGLTVYYWRTKKMTMLRTGLSWASTKNCK